MLALATLVAQPARADEAADKRQAKGLALDAIRLYHGGKATEAYAKLERAEALYPSVTHRVYLARCLDAMGRLVEADERYRALGAEPRAPTLSTRTKAAYRAADEEHEGLRARLPRLVVVVEGSGAAAPLKAVIEEREVDLGGSEAEIPVDPGPGEVRVEGEGVSPVSARFTAVEGEAVEVEVTVVLAPEPAPSSASEGSLVPAFIAYGAGGVGLLVGAVTGGLSFAAAEDVKDQCVDFRCPADLRDEADRSQTLGTVATVGFVVGGAAVAAGVVLTVVRPGGAEDTKARLWPLVGPGWLGLAGRF